MFNNFLYAGDEPGPPGIPIFTRVREDICQIRWQPATNYGYSVLIYQLESRQVDLKDKDTGADGYTNWTILYNGTGSVSYSLNAWDYHTLFTGRVYIKVLSFFISPPPP